MSKIVLNYYDGIDNFKKDGKCSLKSSNSKIVIKQGLFKKLNIPSKDILKIELLSDVLFFQKYFNSLGTDPNKYYYVFFYKFDDLPKRVILSGTLNEWDSIEALKKKFDKSMDEYKF